MYHPNKYQEHDKALNYLIVNLNKVAEKFGGEVQMYFQEQENFRDDGGVIFLNSGEKFLYDFEKRHSHYNGCKELKFDTLGQFERKIQKKEIKLAIQSSTDEKCLILAWHEDYKKEEKEYIKSATENGNGESNAKRFTKDFLEISYDNLEIMYYIFIKAFKTDNFNKASFSLINSPKGKYVDTPIYSVDCEDLIELATKNNQYKKIAKDEIKRRMCTNDQ